jgi:hypothetical protein
MQFLKCEEQLGRTVGPYTCASSIGVVDAEVTKQYMVSRSIGKGSRNLCRNLMGVNTTRLISGLDLRR